MRSLSISQIQILLRQNKLPSEYKLQTPLMVSSAEVVKTLNLFRVEISQGYISAIEGVATPKMVYIFRNVRKLSTTVLKLK